MTSEFNMTTLEVKDAVAEYFQKRGLKVSRDDVTLNSTETRDFADRLTGGYTVTAKVQVRL